jgi:hypothetical protein
VVAVAAGLAQAVLVESLVAVALALVVLDI